MDFTILGSLAETQEVWDNSQACLDMCNESGYWVFTNSVDTTLVIVDNNNDGSFGYESGDYYILEDYQEHLVDEVMTEHPRNYEKTFIITDKPNEIRDMLFDEAGFIMEDSSTDCLIPLT